jgi:predicted nucleotidyltransferase
MPRPEGMSPLISEIAADIIEAVDPERIILFGSHARGTAQADSDIDLIVVMETEERPADACIRVKRAARAGHKGVPMDVLVYTPREFADRLEHGDPWIRQLSREGVLLYAR